MHLKKKNKKNKHFDNGAFAGYVSTDGYSLHVSVMRKAARARGAADAPRAPAALERARAAIASAGVVPKFRGLICERRPHDPGAKLPFLSDLLTQAGAAWAWLRDLGVRIVAVDPGERDWISAWSLDAMNTRDDGVVRPSGGGGGPPRNTVTDGTRPPRAKAPAGRGREPIHPFRRWQKGHTYALPTKALANETGARRAAAKRARRVRAAPTAPPGHPPPPFVTPAVTRARVFGCMHSGRTADPARFARYARSWLAAFIAGRALYGSPAAREDRFNVRRARERMFHRVCQRLSQGHTTVAPGAARRLPTRTRRGLPAGRPPAARADHHRLGQRELRLQLPPQPQARPRANARAAPLHARALPTRALDQRRRVSHEQSVHTVLACWKEGAPHAQRHCRPPQAASLHRLRTPAYRGPRRVGVRCHHGGAAGAPVCGPVRYGRPHVAGRRRRSPRPSSARSRRRTPPPEPMWGPGTSASWHKR